MSHIDEGRLHEWLDGAIGPQSGPEGAAMAHHLATCAECRSRLEAESAVRERARSVLAGADRPVADAPPFAELAARARAEGREPDEVAGPETVRAATDLARQRTRRLPRVGLAWAASISIAVGAGFLGRELVLQRGRDLPAELDFGRESIEAPADAREGLRENVPAAREPVPSDPPARQKSEANAMVEAEKSRAGRGDEERKLDVSERVDADLAEVAAPPVAQRAHEAIGQVEREEISGRTPFAARPPLTGTPSGHPALGCWRVEPGQEQTGIPIRLWLTEDRVLDDADGVLRLETDPASAQSGRHVPGWLPLGSDSVWLSIPPRVFRLASGDDVLAGLAVVSGDPLAIDSSEVRYTRVECGSP